MIRPLPQKLERAIEEALSAMRDDPQHWLPLPYRIAVFAALGPRADLPDASDLRGYQRRATLDITAVRRVLPLWERTRPQDDTPHRILTDAELVVHGEMGANTARARLKEYWNEHVYPDSGECAHGCSYLEHAIFYGALKALGTAASDLDFNPDKIDYTWTDEDNWDEGESYPDASAHAAWVYSSTGARIDDLDAARCREFWEWWVLEAVPATWHAIQ
jgi:hypothetical protein